MTNRSSPPAAGPYNGLKAAGRELRRRLRDPAQHFTFMVFCILPIVGVGGLAIWVEWVRYYHAAAPRSLDGLRLALATAFPATAAAPAVEMMLDEKNVVKSIGMLCLATCFLLALYLLIGSPSDAEAMILGIVGCVFSVAVWWISSADNEALQDKPDVDAASGGPPKRPLSRRNTRIRT